MVDQIAPLPFDQAWTMDSTRRIHEILSEDGARTPQQQARLQELLGQLEVAVGRHVCHLATTSGLQMQPHAEHAKTRFLTCWR